jgi:O-antigen ligase
MTDQSPRSGRRDRPNHSPTVRLSEKIVLGHLLVLIVGISWAFGGQIGWARQALLYWGTIGLGIFVFSAVQSWRDNRAVETRRNILLHLWPLALLNLAVGLSCLNPSFQGFLSRGELYFRLADPPHAWLPSSARPDQSLRALWQFDGIVLSCYNLILVVRSRRRLRTILLVIAANAVLLAIFGTFQKLLGATGPWFGLVQTRQIYFFSTFVYHNHWGAYILLISGMCLGLLFHFWKRGGYRDLWHSPVLAGAVATLLLTATIPLSGSRSCSLLLGVFLLGAVLHVLARLVRQAQASRQSPARPLLALGLIALIALAAVIYLGQDMITKRSRQTGEQLNYLRTDNNLADDSRLTLYRDTWRTALFKPWFGWGLETYGDVFRIYNTQRAAEVSLGQPYYRSAHSDWLQAFAESGVVGTVLLVLLGFMPLWPVRAQIFRSALPRYLLSGCALVLGYALLEFPFANPAVMIVFWCCLYTAAQYIALDDPQKSRSAPLPG